MYLIFYYLFDQEKEISVLPRPPLYTHNIYSLKIDSPSILWL